VMFRQVGVDWSAEKLAADAHERYRVVDDWEATISKWLANDWHDGKLPGDRSHIRIEDVLRDALGFETKHINLAVSHRAGNAMKVLGYRKSIVRHDGQRFRAWVKV